MFISWGKDGVIKSDMTVFIKKKKKKEISTNMVQIPCSERDNDLILFNIKLL